jgi:serine protease Do
MVSAIQTQSARAAIRIFGFVAAFLLLGTNPDRPVHAQQRQAVQALPNFVQLAGRLGPSVVNIAATHPARRSEQPPGPSGPPSPGPGPNPFGGDDPFSEFWRKFFGERFGAPPGPQKALGSGFVIDKQGLILTNNHVVENADKITVRLADEREFDATVVGRDPRTDIAVVRITDKGGDFPVPPLGDSGKLEVGEWVLAMGSPFGLEHTVTAGIVSAKGRYIGAGPYDDFIQTDASINPGNSGGPLINLQGEVVGINTAIVSRSGGNMGIGFAIPINLVKEILPELIKTGKVTRGWLGVMIQRVTPDLAQALGLEKNRGALVSSVAQGSPAEQAGLKPGDVIVEYNDRPIQDSNELPILVARTDVGREARITVMRDNKRIPITVTIGELKEKEEEVAASAPETGSLGLTVQNVTPEIAESLGLDRAAGVVVTSVQPQSPAAEAGIQRGDIILEVNRNRIGNAADLRKILEGTKAGENALFLIKRGGNNLFLALKQPEAKG